MTPSAQATVGIGVELLGVEAFLASLTELQRGLGSLGAWPANPYNAYATSNVAPGSGLTAPSYLPVLATGTGGGGMFPPNSPGGFAAAYGGMMPAGGTTNLLQIGSVQAIKIEQAMQVLVVGQNVTFQGTGAGALGDGGGGFGGGMGSPAGGGAPTDPASPPGGFNLANLFRGVGGPMAAAMALSAGMNLMMPRRGATVESMIADTYGTFEQIPVVGQLARPWAEWWRTQNDVNNYAATGTIGAYSVGAPQVELLAQGSMNAWRWDPRNLQAMFYQDALRQQGLRTIVGMDRDLVATGAAQLLGSDAGLDVQTLSRLLQTAAVNRATGEARRRPEQEAMLGLQAEFFRRRLGTPYLAAGALSGDTEYGDDVEYLARQAAASGDVSGLDRVQQMAMSLPGGGQNLIRYRRLAGQMLGLRAQSGYAAASMGAATEAVSEAQTLRRGYQAVSAALGGQAEPLSAQIEVAEAEARQLRALATPGDPTSQQAALEAETRVRQLRAQLAGVALSRIDVETQGRQAMFSAQQSVAGAQMGYARQMLTGSDTQIFRAAEANERNAVQARVDLARDRYEALRRAGVSGEALVQARAEVEMAETGMASLGATQRAARYQTDAAVAGATQGLGQAEMGLTQGRFYGEEAQQAYRTIRQGLGQQLQAASRQLQEVLQDSSATAGQRAEAQAEVVRLRGQLRTSVLQEVQQLSQDAITLVRQPGQLAGIGLATQGQLGVAPSPELQAQERQAAAAEATQARQNAALARRNGDERAALQWELQAAQAEARAATLPLSQLTARYQQPERILGASRQITSAEGELARLQGLGGADTLPLQRREIEESEANLRLQEAKLTELRQTAPAGSALVREQEAVVTQARLGVAQSRTNLANVTIPVEMRERRSQSAYELQVLQNVPGAYGNIRQVQQNRIQEIAEEMGLLEARLRDEGDNMTPEGRFQLRERIRGLGMEQAGAFQQLSFGWESRLTSQAVNAGGNFGFVANVLASPMRAVMSGIANPHYGATPGTHLDYMRWAGLVSQPTRVPGWQGAMHSEGGTGTIFGGRVRFPSSAGTGRETAHLLSGGVGSAGGGSGGSLTVNVNLRWPDGSQAGTFRIPVAGGQTSAGVTAGEITETLPALPVGSNYRN